MESIIKRFLSEQFLLLDVIIKNTENYLGIVGNLLRSINVGEYEELQDIVKILKSQSIDGASSLFAGIDIHKNDDTFVADVLSRYDFLFVILDLIRSNLAKLQQPKSPDLILEITRAFSRSKSDEFKQQLALTDAKILSYFTISKIKDDQILATILSRIDPIVNGTKIYEYLVSRKNTFNTFVRFMISHVYKYITITQQRKLNQLVEEQKDIALGSQTRIPLRLNYSGIQGYLARYNLVPGEFMDISKIASELNISNTNDPQSLVHEITKSQQLGCIMISINTSSMIEYDIRGLVDDAYIEQNNLKTLPIFGLNQQVIKKYATIKIIPSEKKDNSDFLEITPANHIGNFVVLQKMGDNLVRSFTYLRSHEIPYDVIKGMILGLSARSHTYNIIMEERILPKCFDTKSQSIVEAYASREHKKTSAEVVTNKILADLLHNFQTYLDKHLNSPLSTLREIGINPNIIEAILAKHLSHSNTQTSDKNILIERRLSYIIKFDALAKKFISAINFAWEDKPPSLKSIKEYSHAEAVKNITSSYSEICKNAIESLNRKNTWTDYDVSLKEYFLNSQ